MRCRSIKRRANFRQKRRTITFLRATGRKERNPTNHLPALEVNLRERHLRKEKPPLLPPLPSENRKLLLKSNLPLSSSPHLWRSLLLRNNHLPKRSQHLENLLPRRKKSPSRHLLLPSQHLDLNQQSAQSLKWDLSQRLDQNLCLDQSPQWAVLNLLNPRRS